MGRVIDIVAPYRDVSVQLVGALPEQTPPLTSGEEQNAWRLPAVSFKPGYDFLLLGHLAELTVWQGAAGCPTPLT